MLGINEEMLGTQSFKFLYGDVFERFDLAASVCSFKVICRLHKLITTLIHISRPIQFYRRRQRYGSMDIFACFLRKLQI